MVLEPSDYLNLGNLGRQQLLVDFQGERIVSDAGLLALRALEKPLGVIAGCAALLPDPRSPLFIQHSVEKILTQEVYSLLAGYPDHNDADHLRDDPLFQILADVSPTSDQRLASGSTLARFQYAYTRRQAQIPLAERPVLLEVRQAQLQRLRIVNDYVVQLFLRTRLVPPEEIILDVDPTDDPTHGKQALSGYHGYYRQHQYYPLHVYEGHTGFPLAVWLRPGTVHASCGAVDVLQPIVNAVRAVWPNVRILVRADNGLGVPEVYDFCEDQHLDYVIGYASNAVLQRATEQALADVELYYRCYGYRDPHVQRFEELGDYQAGSWPHTRRVVAKIEINPQGSQRRFVVTNLQASPQVVYQQVYTQRGKVPEQPIGEMKNGLRCERLSSSGFCANAFRLVVHALTYALVVLFREATATVAEVATATVPTLRQKLWKVPAVLVTSARRIWLHVSSSWPGQDLWRRVHAAVKGFVGQQTAPRPALATG
jgi:Transposase DDE domain group 1